MKVPDLEDDDLLIFRKSKKRYDKWENQLIERFDGDGKIFDVFEVSKQQCKMVLAVSFYDFEELNWIQPTAGSCYVLSASEPFMRKWKLITNASLTGLVIMVCRSTMFTFLVTSCRFNLKLPLEK